MGYRRMNIKNHMLEHVIPKNILMIGPTGVGKTEIARRLSNLYNAPFIKVEATRFTEVGYVGKDVESIIRDLVEVSIKKEKKNKRDNVAQIAKEKAEKKVINKLLSLKNTDKKFDNKN